MARKITLATVEKAAFADGGMKFSRLCSLDDIEPHEEFQKLFAVDGALLDRIASSIKEGGFDNSQPVHIWVTEDGGKKRRYLIDGYTRCEALRRAGEKTVPFYEHSFDSFEEAYKYALGLQVNRRNLSGEELLKNVRRLLGTDFIKKAEGKKSKAIADALGVSQRTAERAISVAKKASKETIDAVEKGGMSVNQAYKQGKSMKKDKTPPPDGVSDALEDTSGNPAPLSLTHSRDMGERLASHTEASDCDERLIERFKDGFAEGFRKGFAAAADALFERVSEAARAGKGADEIEGGELFRDLSFDALAPKLGIPTEEREIVKRFNK